MRADEAGHDERPRASMKLLGLGPQGVGRPTSVIVPPEKQNAAFVENPAVLAEGEDSAVAYENRIVHGDLRCAVWSKRHSK